VMMSNWWAVPVLFFGGKRARGAASSDGKAEGRDQASGKQRRLQAVDTLECAGEGGTEVCQVGVPPGGDPFPRDRERLAREQPAGKQHRDGPPVAHHYLRGPAVGLSDGLYRYGRRRGSRAGAGGGTGPRPTPEV